MDFKKAVEWCHVRSAIYRVGDPTKIFTQEDLDKIHPAIRDPQDPRLGKLVPKRYWKNCRPFLVEQVSLEDQKCDDWEEYDPRDEDDTSLFIFND